MENKCAVQKHKSLNDNCLFGKRDKQAKLNISYCVDTEIQTKIVTTSK